MNTISKIPWLKIIGWAALIHIILIAISILEVFIYSLIKPGQEQSAYEEHAKLTAPYVSIIFGFILFYFIVRLLTKNRPDKRIHIIFALPVIYTIMDFGMLQGSGVDWSEHYLIFIISFLSKTLGGYLGGHSRKTIHSSP